jgi:hypothetical protein
MIGVENRAKLADPKQHRQQHKADDGKLDKSRSILGPQPWAALGHASPAKTTGDNS